MSSGAVRSAAGSPPSGTFLDPCVIPAEVRRRAARGLVLDGAGRCLLERVHLHADPGQGTWWELPGGGIEPEETTAAALEREVREETGLTGLRVGPPIATRRIRFRNRQRRIVDQHETIHVVDASQARDGTTSPDPGEAEDLLEVAWHDAAQLASLRRVDPAETITLARVVASGRIIPSRLADLDCVDWSDERDGIPLTPPGGHPHVVAVGGGRCVDADEPGERGHAVVRDAAPWSPTVQALLRHLEEQGVTQVPRALGIDRYGREAVSFVPGSTGDDGVCWAAPLRSDDGMAAVGELLRRLRTTTSTFQAPLHGTWMTGPTSAGDARDPAAAGGASGDAGPTGPTGLTGPIAHGDVGWSNLVWGDDDRPSLIDWEFAQPASPLRDVAQAACWLVPLVSFDHERRGFATEPDRRARLRALAAGAGVAVDDVLAEVNAYLEQETARIRDLGRWGIEPWAGFLRQGRTDGFRRIADYLREEGAALR